MAFTQEAQFSYTVQDELGTKASMVIYTLADPTKTLTNLAADWETFAGLIDLIISGQILHGEARLVLKPSGSEKTAPGTGSRVEQTGAFNFTNSVSPRRFGEAVPSIANAVISGGRIDLADTNVSNFVTAMHTATANTEPTNNTFQALNALADAFISFRKRRRQLERSSLEV